MKYRYLTQIGKHYNDEEGRPWPKRIHELKTIEKELKAALVDLKNARRLLVGAHRVKKVEERTFQGAVPDFIRSRDGRHPGLGIGEHRQPGAMGGQSSQAGAQSNSGSSQRKGVEAVSAQTWQAGAPSHRPSAATLEAKIKQLKTLLESMGCKVADDGTITDSGEHL